MRLFGKKKEEDTAEATDQQELEDTQAENSPARKTQRRGSEAKAAANIERLSAKVEAISELRKTDAERFSRISEQIGELRNLILEKEEEIKELGIKATKASEMVGELQPEQILAEIGKSTAKYESLQAKIEAGNALYQKVLEEVKGIRTKMALFQGTEELLALNNETAQNLSTTKKIGANIERQANLIGNIFTQFQKQYNDFMKEKEPAGMVEEKVRAALKELDALKVKAASALITKEDFEALSDKLEKKAGSSGNGREILQLRERVEDLKREVINYSSQKKISEQAILDTLKDIRQRLDKKEDRRKPETNKNSQAEIEVPGMEKETLADFESKLADLKETISNRSQHSAIILYNQLRETYVQIAKSEIPEGKKYELRSRLLEMHKAISDLMS